MNDAITTSNAATALPSAHSYITPDSSKLSKNSDKSSRFHWQAGKILRTTFGEDYATVKLFEFACIRKQPEKKKGEKRSVQQELKEVRGNRFSIPWGIKTINTNWSY